MDVTISDYSTAGILYMPSTSFFRRAKKPRTHGCIYILADDVYRTGRIIVDGHGHKLRRNTETLHHIWYNEKKSGIAVKSTSTCSTIKYTQSEQDDSSIVAGRSNLTAKRTQCVS